MFCICPRTHCVFTATDLIAGSPGATHFDQSVPADAASRDGTQRGVNRRCAHISRTAPIAAETVADDSVGWGVLANSVLGFQARKQSQHNDGQPLIPGARRSLTADISF
jgi:hypothetical protein